MKYNIIKKCSLIVLFLILININIKVKASNESYNKTMKQDILCLMLAYPEYITGVEISDNELVFIKMKSGNKILYDDKKIKTTEEKLYNADLQDTMEQFYPLCFPKGLMLNNYDPGRYRNYELLKEVYGRSKGEVQANLKNVIGYLQFNQNNGAANELSAAMKEATSMSKSRVEIGRALFPISGTFNYRYIAGTNRLSPHAFGIAIDLASNSSDYWKWASVKDGEKRLLSYPKDLVNIFEGHNFIWGGKWNHFDILHFEYRPEIILKSKYFNKAFDNESIWYEGAPFSNEAVKNKVKVIDKILN